MVNKNALPFAGLVAGVAIGAGVMAVARPSLPAVQPTATTAPASADQMAGMNMSMNEMTDNLSDLSGMQFDLKFLELMIPHHQGAIEMAKLAQEKALHPEVKDLAAEIIKAQEKEIQQMQAWKKSWQL